MALAPLLSSDIEGKFPANHGVTSVALGGVESTSATSPTLGAVLSGRRVSVIRNSVADLATVVFVVGFVADGAADGFL